MGIYVKYVTYGGRITDEPSVFKAGGGIYSFDIQTGQAEGAPAQDLSQSPCFHMDVIYRRRRSERCVILL